MRRALKAGTLCYVVTSCRASPVAARAVGKIVDVVAGPYDRGGAGRGAPCYDVRYKGWVFYCEASKLRAINDPDVDIGEPSDGSLTT